MLNDKEYKGQKMTLEAEGKSFEIVISPAMLEEAEGSILLSNGIETHGGWDKEAETMYRANVQIFEEETVKANPDLSRTSDREKLEAVLYKAQEMAALYKGGSYMKGFRALAHKTQAPTERQPQPTDQTVTLTTRNSTFRAVITSEMLEAAKEHLKILIIDDQLFPQGHEAWQGAITEFNKAAKLANPGLDLTSISEGGHERKEELYKESQRMAANRTGGNYLRIYQKTYRNG